MSEQTRRDFLQRSTATMSAGAWLAAVGTQAKAAPSERIRVGMMGSAGRALSLIDSFARNPAVEVVAIADVDPGRMPRGMELCAKHQGKQAKALHDFRKLIDDPSIDALVIGAPDHWHAIPTILACQAGKDVYVEKPDSHNIVEGMTMVAAMRKHGRIVQMGSQHRATKRLQTALDFVKTGALGRCVVAKAWESSRQGAVPAVPDGKPPLGVDYDMWVGSAPMKPFNVNRFHGRWRWFYDFGTGDLGNDGVHRLDMAIALLNAACATQGDDPVRLPRSIFASGGKWYFDDAQEFPDTMQVNYEFAGPRPKLLTYEMRVWSPSKYLGHSEGSAIFGDKGYLVVGNTSWAAYGGGDKILAQETGDSSEVPHVQNFLDCMKSRAKPYCDLETIGHPASVICHTGNISARLGRKLTLDPSTETFEDDPEANALRTRPEYRKPWLLPAV